MPPRCGPAGENVEEQKDYEKKFVRDCTRRLRIIILMLYIICSTYLYRHNITQVCNMVNGQMSEIIRKRLLRVWKYCSVGITDFFEIHTFYQIYTYIYNYYTYIGTYFNRI